MFDYLPENKRIILLSYPFVQSFLEKNLSYEDFIKDIDEFKSDLIEKGLTEVDIQMLKNVALLEGKGRYRERIDTDNERDKSVEAWRKWWFLHRQEPLNGWIYGKEIRIFKMPEIEQEIVKYVIHGIEDLIKEIGLDFQIRYQDCPRWLIEQLKQAIMADGKLYIPNVSSILINEIALDSSSGGIPHAVVLIVNQRLSHLFDGGSLGFAEFRGGFLIISVPNEIQKLSEFIRSVAKHETCHLLGYTKHYDTTTVNGYKEVADCNMYWRASTLFTCDKCLDAMKYFWKGIEAKTRKKFFKRKRKKLFKFF